MLKLFCGMVIGSLITMTLLGGTTAADQVIKNAQTVFETQSSQVSTTLTIYLLAFLALLLVQLARSITKQNQQTDLVIKKLRRTHTRDL
ncbi:MAG: hypothetical protein NPIRA02_32990 [Nitrospirales bacterium]|nr:MAG: hypothetical protein NPIRA02_32990 [Nitrospirales bacterium]